MTAKVKNVYQRINAVMSELSYLKKDKQVGFGNSSYTAITHDHVTQSLQPLCVKHGLVLIPSMVDVSVERYEVKTKNGTGMRYETKATAKVKCINIDEPGDGLTVETEATAHGFDTQDKSPGKAYSMAVKYCYLKLFMIASGDNEEERVEADKIISNEREKLESELCELLKVQNKLDQKSIAYMKSLDLNGLRDAIARNKGAK